MNPNDDENTKPVAATDDFSDDDQQDVTNSVDAELDAGVEGSEDYVDEDENTLVSDDAEDNILDLESGIDEVDEKVLPEEKQNLGDVIYNPLEEDEEDSEEEAA